MAKVVGDFYMTVNGCEIRKWVKGHAYARNGNTHNPTPRVSWEVYKNGRPADNARTLREAKEFAHTFNEW